MNSEQSLAPILVGNWIKESDLHFQVLKKKDGFHEPYEYYTCTVWNIDTFFLEV